MANKPKPTNPKLYATVKAMAKRKWFAEKWVDLGRKKKDGSFAECGRSDSSKGKYPKCVPMSKAMRMSAKQKQSAVRRKRIAERVRTRKGKSPINVKTIVKE
jgi:hypothetical protein